MNKYTYDIVVLGAGPAGAASALFLAEAGFRVALVEQREFAKAGPSWVNGLHFDAFQKLHLAEPQGEEVESQNFPVVFFSSDLAERLEVAASGFTNVRMRPFVDRLHRSAFAAGVTGYGQAQGLALRFEGDRPRSVQFSQLSTAGSGTQVELTAQLFVDATGVAGALRKHVAAFGQNTETLPDADVCTALQQNCHVRDRTAAAAFLQQLRAEPGTLISILGTQGGYSTLSIQLSADLSEVGILAGAIKDPQYLTGTQMVKKFIAEHGWVGEKIHSGGGAIPLRHPYHRLSAPGVAIVGNAANQVFSVHGSGVMPSLQAARLLADAVAGERDAGNAEILWRYTASFQKSLGAMLASYNLFRRFSQNLSSAEIAKMFRYGLMNEAMMLASIKQVMPEPTLTSGLSMLATGVRDPVFAANLVRSLARMPLVYMHYQKFPETFEAKKFASWVAHAKSLGT